MNDRAGTGTMLIVAACVALAAGCSVPPQRMRVTASPAASAPPAATDSALGAISHPAGVAAPTATTRAAPATESDSLSVALRAYARAAFAGYAEAVDSLESFQHAVAAFLARPTRESLERARAAWIACRAPYSRTETFRYSGGPIDAHDPAAGTHGPEGRINAWPIDEAFLDYVHQRPTAGLISDRDVPIDEESLVSRNAARDDRQVTLGYHAIEFLLWGQDRSRDGPGARPFRDYLPGDPVRERRRACLALVLELLHRDLRAVRDAWDPERGAHAARLLATDPAVALGRALSGPATLAAFELASERLGVPLSSGEQEDEESCFSDNSHRDLAENIAGMALVLEGRDGAPGLLVALRAPGAADVRERLARVRRLAARVPAPLDAALLVPQQDPRRSVLQALLGELIELAGAIQRAGEAAGFRVEIAR